MAGRRSLVIGALAVSLMACSDGGSATPADDDTRPSGPASVATSAPPGTADAGSNSTSGADSIATSAATTTTAANTTTTAAATSSTSTSTSTTTTIAATTTTDPRRPPAVDAVSYAIYDTRSRRFLAESESAARHPVGSLIKLLTAQVAYAAGNPTRIIPAPDGLLLSDDESNIGIRPGQELARDLLIRALLKASANDAARMLAVDIAGSEAAFAERMNATAAALRLTNTHAVNATGLDAEGQYSSANDMTRLALIMMDNPSFQLAVRDPTAELNGQAFPNTNDLIGTYPGADGIKTGRTTGAGWCIIASATRENRRIIVTVLGAPSDEARTAAATALLNWGFAQP